MALSMDYMARAGLLRNKEGHYIVDAKHVKNPEQYPVHPYHDGWIVMREPRPGEKLYQKVNN